MILLQNISLKNVIFNNKKGIVKIKLNNKILKNTKNIKLIISFSGILNDNMKGFYKSKYKRSNENIAYFLFSNIFCKKINLFFTYFIYFY